MNIVLERFFYDKREVGALGTVAIEVFPFIVMFLHCRGKHLLRLIDLLADLGQIGQLHRRSIFVNQRFQIEAIKLQVIVFDVESFLREVKGLRHQIGVRIVH